MHGKEITKKIIKNGCLCREGYISSQYSAYPLNPLLCWFVGCHKLVIFYGNMIDFCWLTRCHRTVISVEQTRLHLICLSSWRIDSRIKQPKYSSILLTKTTKTLTFRATWDACIAKKLTSVSVGLRKLASDLILFFSINAAVACRCTSIGERTSLRRTWSRCSLKAAVTRWRSSTAH